MTSSSPRTELPARKRPTRWSHLLDGTKEFIDHQEMYVVMIGLAIDGEAVLGSLSTKSRLALCRGTEWRIDDKNGAICRLSSQHETIDTTLRVTITPFPYIERNCRPLHQRDNVCRKRWTQDCSCWREMQTLYFQPQTVRRNGYMCP